MDAAADQKWAAAGQLEARRLFALGQRLAAQARQDLSPLVLGNFDEAREDRFQMTRVYVDAHHALSMDEWRHYIGQSYELIKSKLPAKIRRQLDQ